MATDTIHPHIEALIEQAEKAIGGPQLTIDRSPFRFGRESRDPDSKGWLSNRRMFAGPNNECYMHDTGYFRQISREHFQIRQSEDGSYWLEDRGSSCGTWVNDTRLHGASNKIELRNGHKIVVGTIESPYAYTFVATASR